MYVYYFLVIRENVHMRVNLIIRPSSYLFWSGMPGVSNGTINHVTVGWGGLYVKVLMMAFMCFALKWDKCVSPKITIPIAD